ncbi:hypothetical protein CRG98_006065 [Punica granatum]|uniref:UDP-glycosyltransferase 91C1-like n=1 Tax=Punica granatum TaxID=22663 RepID=A0A2I0KYD9_PUNGR|nr:hypothetical protein CRG98_006065 [Punica granatum]
MEKGGRRKMHIVMVPWLAMGHIIPFHHLSICLAQRGHTVSFLSTPKNLQRLPPTPKTLAHLITKVPIPLVHRPPRLPPDAENSLDLSYPKHQLLKLAFASVEPTIASFLTFSSPRPDWIVYDFTCHWLPGLARPLGIRSAYFGLFTAAFFAFLGPPLTFLDGSGSDRLTVERFTAVPAWEYESTSVTPDSVRFAITVRDSDFVAIRTCQEFEPEWFDLLGKLLQKPLVPVGLLPPTPAEKDVKDEGRWVSMRDWLDKQAPGSVVYIALGSEVELCIQEVQHLALGLEKTGLPFLWVLRNPPESTQRAADMLPDGFMERVEGRGIICTEWAPQVRILSHGAVGAFMTHCGCNSFIEGLAFGRVLIMLPMINDQGLNARLLQRKNVGIEVERDERDGLFTPDAVAKAVTQAMVGKAGEPIRACAREAMGLFGNKEKNDRYVDEFVGYLEEHT